MGGLTGSMRDLDKVLAQLGDVDGLRRGASQAVADVAVQKIQSGFRRSVDPSGVRWTALARRRPVGHRQSSRPLLDTYALANSLARFGGGLHVTAGGFSLTTSLPYARRQQYGDPVGGIAPRPFLPDEGLPATWEPDVQHAVDRAIRRHFR